MNERWKRVWTGAGIVGFIVLGVLEYIQLMQSFDLPQIMLVMPVIGSLSFIVLKKAVFIVPIGTIILSCIYQIVAGDTNAVAVLQTNASSVMKVILYVLPICILFELIGIGAGVLIRVLINRKRKTAVGITCLILGVILVFGPYVAVYHNPLYPIQARMKLSRYIEENYNDYKISEKIYPFNLNTSSYECRVVMADGVIRFACMEEDGTVSDGK